MILHPVGHRLMVLVIFFQIPLYRIARYLTSTVETVGYVGRVLSAIESPNWTIGPYVMQSTLLLVAPALYAASIYMELGRIVRLVKGLKLVIIRVNWMTKLFVTGDVLSYLMQASGESHHQAENASFADSNRGRHHDPR
jgi:hypothetical protein